MGLSRHSGPVYGAKGLLWTLGPLTTSTGASTVIAAINASRTVPNYEDWFVTEAFITASTNSSATAAHSIALKVEGGSTTGLPPRPWAPGASGTTNAATILTMVPAGNSTSFSTWATAAVTPGEYEGTWCPAGSSIRLVCSGATAIANFTLQVMGYIRFANSTRSEG